VTSAPSPAAPDPAVHRQCDVLCRYLTGGSEAATDYVRDKYARGLRSLPAAAAPADLLDRALLATARRAPFAVSLADAYAVIARPRTTLRFHLVLLLAVLEYAPGWHARVDLGSTGSRGVVFLQLATEGALAALRLLLAGLLFAPVHALARLTRGPRASA
jgi:hypothetical protein